MGSLFHGIIMEKIGQDYAGSLHESALKPFSQFLSQDLTAKYWTWTINTLSEHAWQEIGERLLQDNLTEFALKNKGFRLIIREKKEMEPVSFGELTRKFYLNENPKRNIKLHFLTPCSFKSANQYVIFPELVLIYQSLMNKYDAFANEFTLKSQKALEHLCHHTRIINYRLRSTRYFLEKVRIPSFMGELDLVINGPETMVSLANLLFSFGKWSGIGMKTALGMGAISIE
jgi:CRISPR-associated endoribonuclease Cas6